MSTFLVLKEDQIGTGGLPTSAFLSSGYGFSNILFQGDSSEWKYSSCIPNGNIRVRMTDFGQTNMRIHEMRMLRSNSLGVFY